MDHLYELLFSIKFVCKFRFVSSYCHAYPCPSVIYATFPEDMHATYGGFYVIDGILPRLVMLWRHWWNSVEVGNVMTSYSTKFVNVMTSLMGF